MTLLNTPPAALLVAFIGIVAGAVLIGWYFWEHIRPWFIAKVMCLFGRLFGMRCDK